MIDNGLLYVRRDHEAANYYFTDNQSSKPAAGWLPLPTPATPAALFSLIAEKTGLTKTKSSKTGRSEVYLQLVPGESYMLEI